MNRSSWMAALCVLLTLSLGVARAEPPAAPTPAPTPAPAIAGGGVLGEDFVLEIEQEQTPTPAPREIAVSLYGNQPRPGETPRVSVLVVESQAKLQFESPFAPTKALLTNPEESTMIVVYQLRVSVAELMRQAGVTGYTDEQYALLSAQEGFDSEKAYVVLSQTKGIPPGMTVEEITLGALPDGSTLPAGEYTGELLMVPFDSESRSAAMVSATINMPFSIATGIIRLTCDDDHRFAISAFNPVESESDAIFSVQVSQAEVERVTGSSHQDEAALSAQAALTYFNPEYEFISLFESEPIAPGEFLQGAELGLLPDGERLPTGEYVAWLVRYAVDPDTGETTLTDANTQLQMVVP